MTWSALILSSGRHIQLSRYANTLSGAFIPEMQIFIGSGSSMSIDNVVHPMFLYISAPLEKGGFTCHPTK